MERILNDSNYIKKDINFNMGKSGKAHSCPYRHITLYWVGPIDERPSNDQLTNFCRFGKNSTLKIFSQRMTDLVSY